MDHSRDFKTPSDTYVPDPIVVTGGEHEGQPVEFVFVVLGGRLECVSVTVGSHQTALPLKATNVRFPLAQWMADARRVALGERAPEPVKAQVVYTKDGVVVDLRSPADRFAAPSKTGGRPALREEFLEAVAAFWRARHKAGSRTPTTDLAEIADVDSTVASSWVYKARKAGLLAPADG